MTPWRRRAGPDGARPVWRRAAFVVLPAVLVVLLCAPGFPLSGDGTGFVLASFSPQALDPVPIPLIRVGIVPAASQIRISCAGEWFLGITASQLRPSAIAPGEAWRIRGTSRGVEVIDEQGVCRGVVQDTLYAYPANADEDHIEIDGKRYRGQFLIWGHEKLSCANVVDLESYLRGVVPQEIGNLPPEKREAVKAQAVAARSYTLAVMGRRMARGFDVYATVEDQVYGGIPAERAPCTDAIEETRGVVALHKELPIRAFYSSTCGGHTSAPDEAWKHRAEPYLKASADRTRRVEKCFCAQSPHYEWTEKWAGKDFQKMIDRSLPRYRPSYSPRRYGPLKNITIAGRSASGRISSLKLIFRHGSIELSGDELRWVIRRPKNGEGLRSSLLRSVNCGSKKGRITSVTITGQGYGHGVGMCQFGAMGMASAGYTYDQIIRFYYRGASLRRFY